MTQETFWTSDDLFRAYIVLSPTGQEILAQWGRIGDRAGELVPATGSEQYRFEADQARADNPRKEN